MPVCQAPTLRFGYVGVHRMLRRAATLAPVDRDAVRVILWRFVVTRLVIFAIATGAVVHLPIDRTEARGFHLPPQPHAFLEAWARYDACWYLTIAQHGYVDSIGAEDMRAAFFPLFPSVIAALTPVVGQPMIASLVISNVCYFVFLVLLWTIVEPRWGERVAEAAVWTYLLFPSAFFLSGAYSESLLLVLTAGALLMAMQRRWLAAGVLVALATLTRPLGVVAVVPVLAEYGSSTERFSSEAARRLSLIVLPLAGALAAYAVVAWRSFGDPLAILGMETAVRGSVGTPWQPFVAMWQDGPRVHAFNNSLIDAVLALAAVVSLPILFAGGPRGYACYALVLVFVPLSESLMSFNRLVLPSFPHAILLARAIDRPWLRSTVFASFGTLQAVWVAAFATWHWVA